MSSKCIDFLYVMKSIIVNDCFVIGVGLSLLSKTVDMTLAPNKGPTHSVLTNEELIYTLLYTQIQDCDI